MKLQFVHSHRYRRKPNLDGCQFEVVMDADTPVLRTRCVSLHVHAYCVLFLSKV